MPSLHQSSDPAGLEKAAKVFKRELKSWPWKDPWSFQTSFSSLQLSLAFTRSKAEDATQRAEELVRHMEELSLKVVTSSQHTVYNTLLSSYATSQTPIVSKRHRLLQR
jgi:hypothetical protein